MVNEGDETFTVLLVRLPAEIDRGTHHEATVTVVDDDDTPSVNLSVSGAGAAAEGGSALTITATRSVTNTSGAALSIPIRVRRFGTTAASADYTVATSIDIANNAASGTTTFTVVDDAVIEPAETVVIELGTLPSGTIAGLDDEITITIADNDTPVGEPLGIRGRRGVGGRRPGDHGDARPGERHGCNAVDPDPGADGWHDGRMRPTTGWRARSTSRTTPRAARRRSRSWTTTWTSRRRRW